MDSCNADLIEQSNSYLSQLWWHQQQNTNLLLAATPGGDNSRATSSLHSQHSVSASNSDVMNQLCRVCGEPAAGFHFGAFTCEGCKSFFGRTYNNLSSISECKNGGQCVINKKNRTSCKACRLRKCLVVGMSKSGSRYGRRSNWFKIHCLLQEQSNNNNNNNIQQSSHHSLLDSKLISKKNEDSSSSWGHKKSPQSPTRSSMIPAEWRNLPSELRNYSSSENAASSLAAAAAAFWTSRGSTLLPHLPNPHLNSLTPSPFLTSPFNNTSFLFPYMRQNSNSKVDQLSTPNTNSPPPSSTPSTCCSPSPTEKIVTAKVFEKEKEEERLSGLALLRTLGPVQDSPMDLSKKNILVKNEHDSDSEDSNNEIVTKHDIVVNIKGETHPAKPATPLDLTRSNSN